MPEPVIQLPLTTRQTRKVLGSGAALPEVDAQPFDVFSISAGVRGLQILRAPEDDSRVTEAKLAPMAKVERKKEILR